MPDKRERGTSPNDAGKEAVKRARTSVATNLPQASSPQDAGTPTTVDSEVPHEPLEVGTLSGIPKMLGFSVSEAIPIEQGAEVSKLKKLLQDDSVQWFIPDGLGSDGFVRLNVIVSNEEGPRGADAFDETMSLELYVAPGPYKLQMGKLPLDCFHGLHYHVSVGSSTSSLQKQKGPPAAGPSFALLKRRLGSSEKHLKVPVAKVVDFVVVGFDPQEWAVADPLLVSQGKRSLLLHLKDALGNEGPSDSKNGSNDKNWLQGYGPRNKLDTTFRDPGPCFAHSERLLITPPFCDEITVLHHNLTPDNAATYYKIFPCERNCARVFVLKDHRRVAYVSMPVIEGKGEEMPKAFTAMNPRFWFTRTIEKSSKEFETFLDGKPCEEGLHACKEQKWELKD